MKKCLLWKFCLNIRGIDKPVWAEKQQTEIKQKNNKYAEIVKCGFGLSNDFERLNSTLHHGKTVSYAREVWGFLKRYNLSQSDTGCQIYTIPSEHFLRATSSSIRAVSLPTSPSYFLKGVFYHVITKKLLNTP